jgi:dimethylargininase
VGLSTRTNQSGIEQLRSILRPFGYEIIAVAVEGSLHLKSVVTAIAEDLVVVDVAAIDPAIFGTRYIEVSGEAANMVRLKDVVLCTPAAAPFAERLEREGLRVEIVDNSELAKAEGALTCCSLLFEA